MNCSFKLSSILAFSGLLFVTVSTTAADWPQWRGPDRNGLGPKSPALANSLAGLSPLWLAARLPSGDQGGRGGLIVHAGKIYGLVSASSKAMGIDEVFCLDAANGKTIWKKGFPET